MVYCCFSASRFGLWCGTLVSTIVQLFRGGASFIGGGNWSSGRKPPTCRKSLSNFITQWCIEYTSPFTGVELTTLVVVDTGCTDCCKFNYHTSRPLLLSYVVGIYIYIKCCRRHTHTVYIFDKIHKYFSNDGIIIVSKTSYTGVIIYL